MSLIEEDAGPLAWPVHAKRNPRNAYESVHLITQATNSIGLTQGFNL